MAERYSICQDFLVPSRYCSKVTTGDVFTPTLLILHHVQCTVYTVTKIRLLLQCVFVAWTGICPR